MFPVLLASSSTAPIWELSGPSWNLIGELEEEVGGGRREGWDESTQNYAHFLNTCYIRNHKAEEHTGSLESDAVKVSCSSLLLTSSMTLSQVLGKPELPYP